MNRNRLYVFCFAVSALLVAGTAWGQTVMVRSTQSALPAGYRPDYVLSALDEGAMNRLYNAGYIAFNVVGGSSGEDEAARARALSVARDGGADYLLNVHIEFATQTDAEPQFSWAEFQVVLVGSNRVVESGRLLSSESSAPRQEATEPTASFPTLAQQLGGEAAQRFIDMFSSDGGSS